MKKVFPLKVPGRVDQRVVEAVKNDVRKYVRRERRKPAPEGFTGWTFACKVGATATTASPCELPEVSRAIDAVVSTQGDQVYIEILAQPVQRHSVPPPR